MDVSPFDDKMCGDCPYPVGKVDNPTQCVTDPYSSTRAIPPFESSATSIDWRWWDIVEDMVNQGSCGSCWAFSTAAVAESSYAIKTGRLYKLSEQHLVSCDTSNWGCQGGEQKYAARFWVDNGCVLDSNYPYIDANSSTESACDSSKANTEKAFYLTSPGYEVVTKSKEGFKAGLRQNTLNISFAVGDDFMYYSSGVYGNFASCADRVNHAMQAVGYGVENGEEYTWIRNQWGSNWGINGYAKVKLIEGSLGVCDLYTDNTHNLVGYDPTP